MFRGEGVRLAESLEYRPDLGFQVWGQGFRGEGERRFQGFEYRVGLGIQVLGF